MTFEEFWNKQRGDPFEIGRMQLALIAWEAGADAKREECVTLLYKIGRSGTASMDYELSKAAEMVRKL